MKPFKVGLVGLFCSSSTLAATPDRQHAMTLSWGKCPGQYTNWPSSVTCAQLKVPMDWDDPQNAQINLTMNKIPARDQAKRIGSLVVNPGGPGLSGMEYAFDLSATPPKKLSDELLDHFDLIGPDPRGIGSSTPIRCNPDLWNTRVTQMPKNESEFNSVMNHWKIVGEDCRNRTGPPFDYFDTISVAKDLEAIRIALGEGPLNYFGSSYGTQLGLQYLQLFPNNVRAFLLDGMTDKTVNETNFSTQEVQSYETVLSRFIAWAEKNNTSALKGSDVGTLLDNLFARADEYPIKAPDCRQDNSSSEPCFPDVSGEQLKLSLQDAMVDRNEYSKITRALLEAEGGNITSTLSQDWYLNETHPDFSQQGAACADWPSSSTWPEWQNRFNLLKSVSPYLQGIAWASKAQIICQNWPSSPRNPPRQLRISGVSAPVLMVNALYDLQTPYTWAVNQQREVEGSVLLTRHGDGHTSYILHGDTQRAMDAYLVNLTMPEPGTVIST